MGAAKAPLLQCNSPESKLSRTTPTGGRILIFIFKVGDPPPLVDLGPFWVLLIYFFSLLFLLSFFSSLSLFMFSVLFSFPCFVSCFFLSFLFSCVSFLFSFLFCLSFLFSFFSILFSFCWFLFSFFSFLFSHCLGRLIFWPWFMFSVLFSCSRLISCSFLSFLVCLVSEPVAVNTALARSACRQQLQFVQDSAAALDTPSSSFWLPVLLVPV